MASIEKYVDNGSSIRDIIGHVTRTLDRNHMSNQAIDFNRTDNDYAVGIVRDDSYKYYRELKKRCFVYGRDDVKTMVGIIITLPQDATDEKAFFKACYGFLTETYFPEVSVISAMVHVDEEQPHMHFLAVPITKNLDKKGQLRYKDSPTSGSDTRRKVEKYKYKISASDVLSRKDYFTFHDKLQEYLDSHGVTGSVKSGVTKAQGGNMRVRDLKRETLRERTEREQKIERNLQRSRWDAQAHERDHERRW